jgi:hypothetical protein
MSYTDNVIDIRRPVEFTIDGRAYVTRDRRQPAADLLVLAGLDPMRYDLGELRRHRPQPVRYENADIVEVRKGTRFISIRDRADVM